MPLKKGQTNNPNGRPKGRPNRLTISNRQAIALFLKKNNAQFKRDWKALKPYERVVMVEKFMSYTTPKPGPLEINEMPEEQMDEILNTLIEKHEARQIQSPEDEEGEG